MTASPPLNGHKRPTMPVLGDWQSVTPEPAEEQCSAQAEAAETSELVAQAQAEAIRAKAWADAEAQRIAAEAAAKAVEVKAAEEARKLKLANDKAEGRAQEEQAAREARIAKHNKERDDADRAAEEERQAVAARKEAVAQVAKEIEAADEKWRSYAIKFAIVCAIVSLPVQMSFFWNPKAPWMAAAPIMLEGAAWVVHRGARAAAVSKRPVWHYRTIVWLLAFLAAGVNLYHGLHSFDPGTAVATAFASIAGPGVWDLHENGRIRKREGVPTRKERKAAEKEAKRLAAEKAERELREVERQAYLEKAEREAAEKLDRVRAEEFKDVHRRAWRLAADLGETAMTEAIWAQAKLDVEGALPGESADVIRTRNAATARVEAAREKRSVNGSTQQVASQVLGARMSRVYNPPARSGRRTRGDVKFTPAASRQASIAARKAAAKKTAQKDQ